MTKTFNNICMAFQAQTFLGDAQNMLNIIQAKDYPPCMEKPLQITRRGKIGVRLFAHTSWTLVKLY